MIIASKEQYLKAKRGYNPGPFWKAPLELLRNEDYLKENKNKTALFQLLCSRIVRAKMDVDPLGIYDNYYKNKYLACSIPMNILSEMFGFKDNKRINDWIKQLVEEGAIKVDKVKVKGQRERNVYIVGVHSGTGDYLYVYDKYNIGRATSVETTPISVSK